MSSTQSNCNELRYSCAKKLEVVQPYNPQVIHFDTPDDFNAYYNKHQDDFNDISTYKLNVKYKIPGFKLSKIQGQLKVVKDYSKTSSHHSTTPSPDVYTRLTALEQRISSIEAYLQTLST